MLKCLNCLPNLPTHQFSQKCLYCPPWPPHPPTNIMLEIQYSNRILSSSPCFIKYLIYFGLSSNCEFIILSMLYSPVFVSPFPNDSSRRCLWISSNCEFIIFSILYSPHPASPNDRIGIIACSDRGQW